MDRETTREIWGVLETNLERLENSRHQDSELLGQTEVAVGMLLECEASEILRCVQDSVWPARALISWLAFEGARLGMEDRINALTQQWNEQGQSVEKLIQPPATAKSQAMSIPARG